MQVLVINPSEHPLPVNATDVVDRVGWNVTVANDYRSAIDATRSGAIDAVILAEPPTTERPDASAEFCNFLGLLEEKHIAGVLISEASAGQRSNQSSLIDTVSQDVSTDELRGRLATIERYHAIFRRMEEEIQKMERMSRCLNQHFQEIDEEMRLAARLQRDFLPKLDGPIGPLRFATLYRPASWVSGDFFDIIRIDENHTGIYVADAVGHGVAASLLTMFIKRSIIPKRMEGGFRTILSPSEVISHLNEALAEQSLPNCQFVTACYGVVDHRTLMFEYARGGHPYPILITKDGMKELETPGGLLGLFKDEAFPTLGIQLSPGDKLLFYTDGVELGFADDSNQQPSNTGYREAFQSLSQLPIEEICKGIETLLNTRSGSLAPQDDITVVGMEIVSP